MNNPNYKIILSSIVNPLSDRKADYFEDGALVLRRVNEKYKIYELGKESVLLEKYKKDAELIDLKGQVILPGFFDMHFHWVQDDVSAMPKDSLLSWLTNYTWPYEAKFKSKEYSFKKVMAFTEKLLSVGTLGGACFASTHPHTAEYALDSFIGNFIVGNVLMTENSPEYLVQSESDALKIVKQLSEKYTDRYALTPRFALTATPGLMKETAKIAKHYNSFIQTHLSETRFEISKTLDHIRSYPGYHDINSYTEVYERCSQLGDKTIVGHGVHLTDEEWKILKNTDTVVAHCPSSNAPISELGLGSGLFDFSKAEEYGVRWALASDIGGGPFLSMLDVMNSFVNQNKGNMNATYIKALFRSTLAGAQILQVADTSGNFEPGKWANFICIKKPKEAFNNAEDILTSIINQNIKRENYLNLIESTYYQGIKVFSALEVKVDK